MPTISLLLAQDPSVTSGGNQGFNWMYLFNPAVVWVFIPLVAIIVGATAKILHRSQEHRERMAMIAAGLHPDFPPGDGPMEEDGKLRETMAHRSN